MIMIVYRPSWKKILLGFLAAIVIVYLFTRGEIREERDRSPEASIEMDHKRFWKILQSVETVGSLQQDGTKVMVWKDGKWERVPGFCSGDYDFDSTVFRSPAGNVSMYINSPSRDVYVSSELKNAGTWESPNFKVLAQHLLSHPEMGLIDVGGHLGSYALAAAKFGRYVVSVEPLDENLLRFCKSIEANNFQQRITVLRAAVSDRRANVSLAGPADHIAAVGVEGHDRVMFGRRGQRIDRFASQAVLLDDLLPVIRFQKAVLKIDVEAHEFHALSGGARLFASLDVRVVMMEWANVKLTTSAEPLIRLLTGYGFRPYTIYASDSDKVPKTIPLNTSRYFWWPFDVQWLKD